MPGTISDKTPSALRAIIEAVRNGNMDVTIGAAYLGMTVQELNAQIKIQGLIDQLDGHIRKVMEVMGEATNMDPNDPNHDPVPGWLKEIAAAVKNLKDKLKRLPKNREKRRPAEDAIKRGEDFLNRFNP